MYEMSWTLSYLYSVLLNYVNSFFCPP